jgi:hypothetical protein
MNILKNLKITKGGYCENTDCNAYTLEKYNGLCGACYITKKRKEMEMKPIGMNYKEMILELLNGGKVEFTSISCLITKDETVILKYSEENDYFTDERGDLYFWKFIIDEAKKYTFKKYDEFKLIRPLLNSLDSWENKLMAYNLTRHQAEEIEKYVNKLLDMVDWRIRL